MSFTSELPRSRWSDVYIASFAQFFGSLATFLVMVTLVLSLQRQGARGLEVSVLIICEALPMVILGKFIGQMVDRIDSKVLMAVSGIGQIAACLALSQATTYWAILTGAIALSVVSGVGIPARQALLPAMVTREDLPKAIAIGQTAGSAGMMIGPALAGFMVFGVGVTPTLRLASLGFIATVIAAFLLRTRRGGAAAAAAHDERPQADWKLGDDRLLWSSVWGLTVVVAALSAVNVVLVFFIIRTLHSTERLYGVVDSVWTVGVLAGAWIFTKMIKLATTDVALTRRLFTILGIASAALVAVGAVQQALWIVPFYLIGGIQNGGLNVLAGTLMGRRAPAEARGRANTAMGMRVNAGALFGYLGGGLLLELSEPRWIVIGCGVLGVIAAVTVAPLVLRSATVPKGENVRYAEAS
jgi:MFS family permease